MGSIGDINAHTHLYSALAPFGMPPLEPPPGSFLDILERLWWRLDRALDEELIYQSARYGAAYARLYGTAALIDHHESPDCIEGSLDILADACQELGVRALLCYGATERNGGREEAKRGLLENERFLKSNRRPLVRGLVGIHAGFTVSDETLREAGDLCRAYQTALHIHAAEDEIDVADARRRGYAGPLSRLRALNALVPGSIAAHGIYLSEAELKIAENEGVWLVQNPRSNENNRVGYPHGLKHCSRVALGTDGFPSNMKDEQSALLRIAREAGDDMESAGQRLGAGRRLLEEHFGAALNNDRIEDPDIQKVRGDFASIEQAAKQAAERLWTRMHGIPVREWETI